MAENDLKKTKYASERHDIAHAIVVIKKLKSLSQEKKEEIIQELLAKKELTQTPVKKVCPFPQHEGYVKIWNNLKDKPEQQKYMKENIKISADGKIEMIKMKKKFSILQAQHNGKDIFKGEYADQYGKITYLTGRAAEKECDEQKKQLLKDRAEVEKFISYFPGENDKERIFNFVNLFGLEKAGYWSPKGKGWTNVGSVGYVKLSRVSGRDYVYEVEWTDCAANLYRVDQEFPSPFVVFEDCSA